MHPEHRWAEDDEADEAEARQNGIGAALLGFLLAILMVALSILVGIRSTDIEPSAVVTLTPGEIEIPAPSIMVDEPKTGD